MVVVLLATALVVAGLVPPAVRHTHAGGDDPFHAHPAGHSHHVATIHHHEGEEQHAQLGLEDHHRATVLERVAHLHFSWFGIGLTLADGPSAGRSDTGLPSSSALVQLLDEQPASAPGPCLGHLPRLVALGPGILHLPAVEPCLAACAAPMPGVATLLCDRARHERSGVQLI